MVFKVELSPALAAIEHLLSVLVLPSCSADILLEASIAHLSVFIFVPMIVHSLWLAAIFASELISSYLPGFANIFNLYLLSRTACFAGIGKAGSRVPFALAELAARSVRSQVFFVALL
jgi:hypothetical protein